MSHDRPVTVVWLRVLLALLFLGGAYELRLWFVFFPLAVVVLAVPPLVVLALAVLANRRSRIVFWGILATVGGYLVWAVLNLGTLVTLTQPHLVVVLLSSAAALVVLLRPDTRAHYTTPVEMQDR